ncbi:hypothetical protein KSF78_0001917 [Schistosoma japonicum]|nr:hypothetical protein KSF78_0001917 [Schistosoma japonicum]KAH8855136.1 hypothetical protein KSF78_0001917 [Schistosoma japonicum]KAH8855137.1 hypothetical protein KSF78_0001917 [Schistosoma japonicum]
MNVATELHRDIPCLYSESSCYNPSKTVAHFQEHQSNSCDRALDAIATFCVTVPCHKLITFSFPTWSTNSTKCQSHLEKIFNVTLHQSRFFQLNSK